MPNSLNVPKTTFSSLEYIYNEILEARATESPQNGLDHKKGREINAKIIFHNDNCYIGCKEIFDVSFNLIEYYYDWYAGNGKILQKFHAHYHPKDAPDYVTQFDPWHFHVPLTVGDKDGERVSGVIGYTIHDALKNEVLPYIMRNRRSGK